MKDEENQVLLKEIRERPESGARLLVGAYGRRLYATAFRLCRHETDAEDLVARTLARVIEKAGDFGGGSALFTWMCSIMANFFKMDLRRKGANALVFPEEMPDAADAAPTPAEALERSDDAGFVRAAVASLPERQRAAVVFFYFDRMSVPEIAESLGEPEGTVYYWLHEAKKTLREKLSRKAQGFTA